MHERENPPAYAHLLFTAGAALDAKAFAPYRHLARAVAANRRFVFAVDLFVDPPEQKYAAVLLTQLGKVCRLHVQRLCRRTAALGVYAMTCGAGALKFAFPCFDDVFVLGEPSRRYS